ncbi:54S ribosomal protein L12, mitochondrial [Coemansia sp. RSA 2704]|nr:54S ribosomal protein L12, mitochondrial [Coemansia sp. RSA 2705]KAJ2321029.1 54S ribosomal protein L12, mitochondrial [Coemansia sp. RSA 2704]
MFRLSLVRSVARPLSGRRLVHASAIRRSAEPIPAPEGSGAVEASPKIASIVDSVAGLTLLETSQLVDALKTKFNITEAVQVVAGAGAGAPAGGAGAAAAAEEKPAEKTEFKVTLKSFKAEQKAKVIREIKGLLPDMNLVAAKKFVESAPKVINDTMPKADAEKIKKALEAVGAEVTLE